MPMLKSIVTFEKIEKGYVYHIPYLNSIKDVYVDKKLPHTRLAIYNYQGNCSAQIKDDEGKFVSLNIYLYGKKMAKKNGNTLDYRKDNCVDFSMSEYNISKRKYNNSTGYVGVIPCSDSFTFSYQRNGKVFRSKIKYPTALEAYEARVKVIKGLTV